MADFYIVPPRLTVGSFDRADAVTSLNSLKGDITITADPSTGLRVSISSGQFAFSITPNFYIKKSGDTVPGNIRFIPSGSNYGLAVAAGVANPGTGTTGALFLNTADGKLKYHDGWAWQDITAVAGIALTTADLRYLKLDGTNTPTANISMGSQFLRFANLATQVLAGSAGQVFYNTDTNKLNVYNGSAWTAVGSGITSISVGVGLTTATSPITDSGTISVNLAYDFTWTGNHTFNNTVNFAAAGQTFGINKLFIGGQTAGDLIYFDGSNWNRFGIGTTNQVLSINASGSGLTWAAQTGGGGGAGTVYNGVLNSIPYYPSTGTAITGSINFQNTGTGISIAYTTASTNTTTGALTVLGGVGIGGSLNVGSDVTVGTAITGRLTFSQATFGSAGATIIPSMAFIGATNSPITLSVLADNSLSFDGSSGQLFSINNNLSTGWIFAVNDISGLPLLRANADGTVAMGEFAGNIGIGLSNPSYKLHVNGDTNLSSGYVYRINGTPVLSSTQVLGLTVSSGNITSGAWSGTAISAPYGGTGLTSYTVGDILYAATSSSLGKLSAGTAGSVLVSAGAGSTPYYLGQLGLAAGTAVTSSNINIIAATSDATHPLVFTPTIGSLSGVAVSSRSTISFNPSTDIMSVSGLAVTSSTASINSSTGALTVAGGVGIGGSLFSSPAFRSSLSGVAISNGVVQSGSWAGSTITGLYGGTGYTNYTKGDLLVGAGNTFVKLSAGTNGYVLGANSTLTAGLGWTTVTEVTVSTTSPVTAKNADLWFNSEDGSLSVYYQDVDTSQWVEIAVGSGIDLTNTVHITSSVGSTNLVTGALIVDGGAGIAGTVNAQSFVINELYDQIGTSLITSTTTANQVALLLSSSAYRSAKIFVQASSGSTFHSQEILMVHDGSNVYMTEYSIVNTGAIGSTFDADLSGGNMRFLVTPTFAVTTYKIACTAMRI